MIKCAWPLNTFRLLFWCFWVITFIIIIILFVCLLFRIFLDIIDDGHIGVHGQLLQSDISIFCSFIDIGDVLLVEFFGVNDVEGE